MGILDKLTGTKRPADGVAPRGLAEVKAAILAVNRSSAPFVVYEADGRQADVIAEWRIVDANWYGIFAKAGMKKIFRVLLRFDESKHEVRAVDQEYSVEWRGGVPFLSFEIAKSRGQIRKVEFGQGWAFTEQGRFGEVYNYKFSTGELKPPLQKAVTDSGWTWTGVVFGKL
ncbi:MAG: hypothetical protein QOI21_3550 [Actinomycetota bacterium]|nr:hypothetical protein [Actinomycetota bacterium]